MANFDPTVDHFQAANKVFGNGETQLHMNVGAEAFEISDFLVSEEEFDNSCKNKDAGDYNFNTVQSGPSIEREYGRFLSNNPPSIHGVDLDHDSTVIQTLELPEKIFPEQSKKRKAERPVKYAFLTRSETDILEDGYKWCKYGKKLVKNSPNPRSYYRCSDMNCDIKKTVQRDAKDKGIVITTYLGKHNHQSPKVIYYNTGNLEVLQASSGRPNSQISNGEFSPACN